MHKTNKVIFPEENFSGARLEIGWQVFAVPGEKREVLYLKTEPDAKHYLGLKSIDAPSCGGA